MQTPLNLNPTTLLKFAQKILGDEDASSVTSLVPGIKSLRLNNSLECD